MAIALESQRGDILRNDVSPGAVMRARPPWVCPELFPFTSRSLDVEGARLHYVDEGRGPALLMIPGSPMWSFTYRYPIEKLRSEFRCIAVDLPGLGLSQAPLCRGKAFARNADWLQAFVRALELRDFTLIVHSTAGPSALEMAVRERERIRALVVSNSFAWPLEQPVMRRFARIVSSPLFGFVNVRFNLLPLLTARVGRRTGRFSPRERAAILGPFENRRAREHLQNYLYGIRAEREMFQGLGARLKVLGQTPALFLYGAHDNGFKAGFPELWKRLLPNSRTVVLAESGHFPLEDEPERYTAELKLWLRRTAGHEAEGEGN